MAIKFEFAESLMPLIKQAFIDVCQYDFITSGREGSEQFNTVNSKVSHSHRFTNIQVMYTARHEIIASEVDIWINQLKTLLPEGTTVLNYSIFQAQTAQHRASVMVRFSQEVIRKVA